MARNVSDSDSVRRQNRGLVLGALRVHGPLSRTALAAQTGLSHASITAITQDLMAQDIIVELRGAEKPDAKHARPPGRRWSASTAPSAMPPCSRSTSTARACRWSIMAACWSTASRRR